MNGEEDFKPTLPDALQGRWVNAEDSDSEFLVVGDEMTCFGEIVNYDFAEISDEGGALSVSLCLDDKSKEDEVQRRIITGLALTPDGQLHAYNVKFASSFVRLQFSLDSRLHA